MSTNPTSSTDPIIDVQVLLTDDQAAAFTSDTFVRETLANRPLDLRERWAMQKSIAALLVPELERVWQGILRDANYRVPATPTGTQAIESALAARLVQLGVDDVFIVKVRSFVSFAGSALAEIWLGPTDTESARFGFYTGEAQS